MSDDNALLLKLKRLRPIRVRGRMTLMTMAATFALAGCGSLPTIIGPSDSAASSDRQGSIYGNYLAGRYAGANRDTDKASEFFQKALAQDPSSAIVLERAFLLEVADGDIDQAIELANRIVARDAENRIARLVLALHAFKIEDFEAARTHLSQGRSGPLNAIVSDIILAWTYAAEGDDQQALASLEKGANSSLSVFYVSARGHIHDYLGHPEQAEADYAKAYNLTEGHTLNTVLSYASILARRGKVDDARTVYESYLALAPDHAIIKPALARLNAGQSITPFVFSPERGVALAIYNPASYLAQERAVDLPIAYLHLATYMDPSFDAANILLADLYESSDQWDKALDAYSRIPKSSDYYFSAQIQYAVNLDRMSRTDEAVHLLRSMVSGGKDDVDVYSMLGDMLRFREDFDDAVDAYTNAINGLSEKREEDWGLYYARGVCLERIQRWPEAEQDFLAALALSPDQPLVLNYLGYSWIEQGQHFEKALELIQTAVSIRPDDGFIVDSLGWAYYKIGDFEKAALYLERAVELQPTDPTINEHLGDAYWQVGRRNEARFQWNHALELVDPDDDDTVSKLKRKLTHGPDIN